MISAEEVRKYNKECQKAQKEASQALAKKELLENELNSLFAELSKTTGREVNRDNFEEVYKAVSERVENLVTNGRNILERVQAEETVQGTAPAQAVSNTDNFGPAETPVTPQQTPVQPSTAGKMPITQGGFGQSQQTAPASFGQQTAPRGFGQVPTGFGQPQQVPAGFGQPAPTPFGAQPSAPAGFGQAKATEMPTTPTPFGAQPSAPAGFGQAKPQQVPAGFGQRSGIPFGQFQATQLSNIDMSDLSDEDVIGTPVSFGGNGVTQL